jgi:hypothetical protein
MKKQFLSLLLPGVLIPAIAQQSGPPPVMGIVREAIKEGRGAAHEKVETDYARTFRKANLPSHYIALESMSGTSEVWFLEAFASFAAVEQDEKYTQKQPMKSDLEMLDARDGELRASSRNMYAVYRKDLSYRPDRIDIGKARYVMISSLRVRLGKQAEFMNGSKVVLGGYEKSNSDMPLVAYEVIAGAPDGLFLFLAPMESLKKLDGEEARQKAFIEALGPENAAQLLKGTGDVFTSMESSLFSVNPKMSYVSKEVEDVDPGFWRPKPAATKPAGDAKPTGQ